MLLEILRMVIVLKVVEEVHAQAGSSLIGVTIQGKMPGILHGGAILSYNSRIRPVVPTIYGFRFLANT